MNIKYKTSYLHLDKYLILLVLSSFLSTCFANIHTIIKKKQLPISLADKIYLVKGPYKIKNYKDVLKLPNSSFLVPKKNSIIRKSLSNQMKWGKILINLNKLQDSSLVISHGGQVEYIEFFLLDDQNNLLSSGKNGISVPTHERSMYMGNYGVKLSIPKMQNITIIFKYKSFYVSSFNLTLENQKQYDNTSGIQIIIWSLYLGLALGMIIYNLFLFISTRNITYFYYSFVTIFFTININSNFHAFKGMQTDIFGHLLDKLPYFGNGLTTISFVLFMIHIIDLKSYYLKMTRIIHTLNVILCFFSFLPLFLIDYFSILQEIQSIVLAQVLILTLATGFKLYLDHKQTHVKLTLIAFSLFGIAGAFAHADIALGSNIPSNYLANAILIGSAIELILMSVAMTFKIKEIREKMTTNYKKNKDALELLFKKKNNILNEVNTNIRKFSKNGQIGEFSNQVIKEISSPLNELFLLNLSLLTCRSSYNKNDLAKIDKGNIRIDHALQRITSIASKTLLLSPNKDEYKDELNQYLISDLIHEIIDTGLKELLTQKSITLKTPVLLALRISNNKKILSHSIRNLLLNSIDELSQEKYIDKNKEILISCYQENNQIIILVEDSGEGMSKEIVSKSLLPFHTTRLHTGNLGLGLATSSSLLSTIGGKIKFKLIDKSENVNTYISLDITNINESNDDELFIFNEAI